MPVALVRSINHLRLVSKRRRLVYPGDVYVSEGQIVEANTVIARTELDSSAPLRIKVSAYFGIPNDKVPEVLNINTGDSIKKGEEIATLKKGLFSKRLSLTSPYTGIVEHISLSRGEVIVRERYSADESLMVVNIAEKLNISPFFLKTFMHVFEGQDVTYNEILASTDGMGSNGVRSPVRGKIERIDTRTGTVSIRRPYSPVSVHGYISGTVKEVLPQYGAVIETPACYIEGVFGVGNETFGEIVILVDNPKDIITEDMIKEEYADKVIVGGAGITYGAMQKAHGVHIRGIIVGGIKNFDVVKYVGKEISVGITGQEEKDITIIATEGFGFVPMMPQTFELLRQHESKIASINGTTQIRAGVIRPEIIIPLNQAIEEQEAEEETLLEPKTGMKVRIISDPYYGSWGVITEDGSESIVLANGTHQNVVNVKLDDGRDIKIGENNLLVYEV